MIDSTGLVADLKKQALILEDDLRTRLSILTEVDAQWRADYRQAREAERTAGSWVEWRDDRITQAAVAWALTCVFIRFCEDNALLRPVWISGPGARHQEALDAQLDFFRRHPDDTDREWLLEGIGYLGRLPATRALVDEHSALWLVSPSGRAVTALLDLWRRRDEAGRLMVDFTDPELSTWFLGDLYQDISEHAKKTYALLQTPEFIEEFILDQTMEPALGERPLEGFRLIDPACGSGHFLLGAFRRLLERWDRHAPSYELQYRVQLALDAVHGVDINPFAVAIARFRLTVAALKACGLTSLEQAPAFDYHLATGDSLLFGNPQGTLPIEGADYDQLLSRIAYRTEDLDQLKEILQSGRYDAVVGNPPYITVKDKKLNDAYRARYLTCKGKYALTVPFMERFFQLATPDRDGRRAGWIGQITSNSFMKREFGSKLIEEFLAHQDLRLVADTSGAYIPGHGTPTMIIVGRHAAPASSSLRAVLGIRGEPDRPLNPSSGRVWSSIIANVNRPGHEDEYVSVIDIHRSSLTVHPWSLSGGSAGAIMKLIDGPSVRTLRDHVARVGFYGIMGSDPAMLIPHHALRRTKLEPATSKEFAAGESVRDYSVMPGSVAWFPYDSGHEQLEFDEDSKWSRHLWPNRTLLGMRPTFSGGTYFSDGRSWWEWHQLPKDRGASRSAIVYANVATHNHFAVSRRDIAYSPHASVIKLPEGASEVDHLGLLGVLNTSLACFWLKQNSHDKGRPGAEAAGADEPWEHRFEFAGTTLADFPVAAELPVDLARELDQLATCLSQLSPPSVCEAAVPTAERLAAAARESAKVRRKMVTLQEELDWGSLRLVWPCGWVIRPPYPGPAGSITGRKTLCNFARA